MKMVVMKVRRLTDALVSLEVLFLGRYGQAAVGRGA